MVHHCLMIYDLTWYLIWLIDNYEMPQSVILPEINTSVVKVVLLEDEEALALIQLLLLLFLEFDPLVVELLLALRR